MRKFALVVATVTTLALPFSGHAQTTIYSDSFESDTDNTQSPVGWTDVGSGNGNSAYVQIQTATQPYAGEPFSNLNGAQAAFLYLHGLSGTTATSQGNDFSNANVGHTYAANTTYTLTYLYAEYGGGPTNVSLMGNGAVVSSTTKTITTGSTTFAAGPTVTIDTAANPGLVGQNIGVDFNWSPYTGQYFRDVAVDNVQITSTPDVSQPSVIYADSFESDTDNTQTPVGWTDVGSGNGNSAYVQIQTATQPYAGEPFSNLNGVQAAFLYLHGLSGTTATSQGNDFSNANVGHTYAANTTYTLTYLYAEFGGGPTNVSLMANASVISGSTQTITGGSTTFAAGPTITVDTATNPSLVGQNIGIDVNWSPYTGQYFRDVAVDNFQVTATPDTITNTGFSTIGVNLAGDWLWADALRQGRSHWDTAAHLGDGAATEDANNWPTEDCSLVVWEGHAYNDGTYALTFNGEATIAVSYGYGTVNGLSSSPGTYNSSTNTTTATVVITDTGSENMSLIFTNTKRTSSSATNTGITNVHFYRPTSEGATTSYSSTTLFTNQTLAMSAKFPVTRFMDQLAVNNSTVTNWSDRALPGSWNQKTLAYEYVVAYGNASDTDIYVNIPLYATSTYVTNLANLIKYGSDGVNPYTSVQSSPVYAPLNSNLHVYLEYSNEVWNGGFAQCNENYNIVSADKTANNAEWAILNYDGAAAGNLWTGAWRRVIYQAKLISDSFRAVYGNAAMPPNANPTIRPLIEFQADNGQATGSTQLQFLDNYFNNSDGVSHVTTPEPVNYFLWGGGGATYYTSNSDSASTVDAIFASGVPWSGYAAMVQADSALAKGYGIKRVAYEGGWALYDGTNGYENVAGSAAALAKYDSRATTAEENAQTVFQQSGGDLNIIYTSSSWDVNYVWSMTDEIFNLNVPLYLAVNAIGSSTPAAITYGNAISGTSATTLAYGSQLFSDSTYNSGLPDNGTLGWVPLIPATHNYQVSLNINSTSSGKYVRVLLDGKTIGGGAISVPVSSTAQNVVVATVNLTAGQHGLLVDGQYTSNNNYSGNSCTFTSIVLTPVP